MTVRTEMKGPVLVVTLDRPRAHNALDAAMIGVIGELFERIAGLPPAPVDPAPADGPYRPRAIVLRSEGPTFCAGADLGEMKALGAAGFDENLEAARAIGAMFRAVRLCPVPVVARVQGPAYGGGVGLLAACDIVVADTEAKFAFTEARLGLVAGVIAPLVIGRVGEAAARHAFLTGDPFGAPVALRLGLVDRLADAADLDDAVARVVRSLLAGGPLAHTRIKQLIEGLAPLGFAGSLDFTARALAETRTAPEAQAALAAFLRKEPAPFARETAWPPAAAPGGPAEVAG
ncbi:MAG: enoyl-CoA hydratase-related protein [Candidatus Krumholzibacteriia bacterium]